MYQDYVFPGLFLPVNQEARGVSNLFIDVDFSPGVVLTPQEVLTSWIVAQCTF